MVIGRVVVHGMDLQFFHVHAKRSTIQKAYVGDFSLQQSTLHQSGRKHPI